MTALNINVGINTLIAASEDYCLYKIPLSEEVDRNKVPDKIVDKSLQLIDKVFVHKSYIIGKGVQGQLFVWDHRGQPIAKKENQTIKKAVVNVNVIQG